MKKNKLESILLKKVPDQEKNKRISNKNKLKNILFDKRIEKIKESKKYLEDAKRCLESWDEAQFKNNIYCSKNMFESFYNCNIKNEDVYSGYAECLYIIGDYEKANSIYNEGLNLFPNSFDLKEGKKHVKKVLDSLK